MFIKSPFNYIGNKYKLLGQLLPCFPKQIDTFVDLCCGGGDVVANVQAKHKRANDINYHVVEIMQLFQKHDAHNIIKKIDETILSWGLSKEDKDAYEAFRRHYNSSPNPLDLYTLMCFSFNYQFRFNSAHEYNNPFGRNRSSFNQAMRSNLLNFIPAIHDVIFTAVDFRDFDLSDLHTGDFVYVDPPYTITTGSYNDGKRGFKGWQATDDIELTQVLNELTERGIKFAMSNVMTHKGQTNFILTDWVEQNSLFVTEMDWNYDNCNYQAHNKSHATREVLITNYETPRSNLSIPVQGELFMQYY